MTEIIVIGHKNPDTDSIVSAIAYARLKVELGEESYIAGRCGEPNEETKYVLKLANLSEPKLVEDVSGKKVVLVDHNELSQACTGIENAEILEIVDHHKLNFSYPVPIYVLTEPLGSTATIITKLYLREKVEIGKELALALLGAILSDTVELRSSTTTETDRRLAEKLAELAEIEDLERFGVEVKKRKANIANKTATDVLLEDFKEFEFPKGKVGIAQVELVDFEEVDKRKKELIMAMERLKKEKGLALVALMATNIIKGDTRLLCVGELGRVEEAFGKRVEKNEVYLENVMSRKKDVVPKLQKVFS